jgi:hypothetical protein
MSTNGTIAVQHYDGKVSVVYSHWDNYLEYNGKLLQEYYNSIESAEALIMLGNISSLGKRLDPINKHGFEFPEDDTTVAYHRDRGEDLEIDVYESLDEYFACFDDFSQEYNYLWTEAEYEDEQRKDCWCLVQRKSDTFLLEPLETLLETEE